MKPALDEFFENYGKKKGVELLNLFFKEVEDDIKPFGPVQSTVELGSVTVISIEPVFAP